MPLILAPRQESNAVRPFHAAILGGFFTVPVAQNGGEAHHFVFDTGSDRSFLSPSAFARLKAAGNPIDAAGTMTVSGLVLGGTALPPVRFRPEVEGFAKLSVDDYADGVLGTDVWEGFRVGLNLAKDELAIYPLATPIETVVRDWFAPASAAQGAQTEYHILNLGTKKGRYSMWMDVDNVAVPAVIDTGSSLTFVGEDFLPYVRGAKRKRGDAVRYYGGDLSYDRLQVPWVGPGNTPLGGPQSLATLDGKVAYYGIYGRDLLAPYRVILDYSQSKVYFIQGEGHTSPPHPDYGPVLARIPVRTVHAIVRYPADKPVHLPPGSTAETPAGTVEVVADDGRIDILPPGTAFSPPSRQTKRPDAPPPAPVDAGNRWRWTAVAGWSQVPNRL